MTRVIFSVNQNGAKTKRLIEACYRKLVSYLSTLMGEVIGLALNQIL